MVGFVRSVGILHVELWWKWEYLFSQSNWARHWLRISIALLFTSFNGAYSDLKCIETRVWFCLNSSIFSVMRAHSRHAIRPWGRHMKTRVFTRIQGTIAVLPFSSPYYLTILVTAEFVAIKDCITCVYHIIECCVFVLLRLVNKICDVGDCFLFSDPHTRWLQLIGLTN